MRSPIRCVSALGAVFFAAVGISACGGGIPGDAVVQVNGTPITKSALNHWMRIAASSSQATPSGPKPVVVMPDPPSFKACIAHLRSTQPKPAKGQPAPAEAQLKTECEQQYKTNKDSALNFLIQSSWIIGQAEEMKISATNREIEKIFNKLKRQQFPKESEFQKFLANTDQTVSDLELRVKVQSVLTPKIEKKIAKEAKKPATTAEAKKYYNEHKSLYGKPERRNLLVVVTKTEAEAKSAKNEIQSGKSWASVAKARSTEPISKVKGGNLYNVERGQHEEALNDAIFAAKLNTLVGPLKTPSGSYVFEVKKIMPGSPAPFSTVESSIKKQLATTNQQKKLQSFITNFKKRWTSRTECRPQYMVELCKGYKAPKPATPSGSTPTTTSSTSSSKTK